MYGYKTIPKRFLIPVSTVQKIITKYKQIQMVQKNYGKVNTTDPKETLPEVNLNPKSHTRNPGIDISQLTLDIEEIMVKRMSTGNSDSF